MISSTLAGEVLVSARKMALRFPAARGEGDSAPDCRAQKAAHHARPRAGFATANMAERAARLNEAGMLAADSSLKVSVGRDRSRSHRS